MSRIVATEPTGAMLEFPSEAELTAHSRVPISDAHPAASLLAFHRETADDNERRVGKDPRTWHEMRSRISAGYELFIQSLQRSDR